MKSVLKQIYDCLKKSGFDVYFPSQHKGECIEPYVVVKMEGTYSPLVVSSERPIYTILVYVPENRYSVLEQMIFEIKQSLKQIYPLIEYIGNETPSYWEDEIKATMISIQYYGCRKIEHF